MCIHMCIRKIYIVIYVVYSRNTFYLLHILFYIFNFKEPVGPNFFFIIPLVQHIPFFFLLRIRIHCST